MIVGGDAYTFFFGRGGRNAEVFVSPDKALICRILRKQNDGRIVVSPLPDLKEVIIGRLVKAITPRVDFRLEVEEVRPLQFGEITYAEQVLSMQEESGEYVDSYRIQIFGFECEEQYLALSELLQMESNGAWLLVDVPAEVQLESALANLSRFIREKIAIIAEINCDGDCGYCEEGGTCLVPTLAVAMATHG